MAAALLLALVLTVSPAFASDRCANMTGDERSDVLYALVKESVGDVYLYSYEDLQGDNNRHVILVFIFERDGREIECTTGKVRVRADCELVDEAGVPIASLVESATCK